MAQLGATFEPESVEPRDNLGPVPIGVYPVEVVESEVVETKSRSGSRINLTLKIIEGQYEGRLIWSGINYLNANEVAQRIGQQELAELCAACGHRGPLDDTDVLHGIPIKVRVKMSKPQEGYDQRNEVSRYMAYDSASAPPQNEGRSQPAVAAQAAKATGTAAKGAMPWKR